MSLFKVTMTSGNTYYLDDKGYEIVLDLIETITKNFHNGIWFKSTGGEFFNGKFISEVSLVEE